jgi:membrane protease YdiL (CAAX protease family)
MLFIFAVIAVSWILLWTYERSHITVLGVVPTARRSVDLVFGLISSAVVASGGHYLVVFLSDSRVSLNPDYTAASLLSSVWWIFRSVVTEELLFRGVLLYLAIKMLGTHRACALSAFAFGIYHWFSYGVIGQPVPMIYVFLLTGVAGLMFAYAFALTSSMYFPVGLHLGWNFVSIAIFSQGPLGDQLLLIEVGNQLGSGWSVANFVYQISVLPLLTYFYLRQKSNSLLTGKKRQ